MEPLQDCLEKTWRVTIKDGRQFTGTCTCVDKRKNVLLTHTVEYAQEIASRDNSQHGRHLGLVMIPGNEIVKAEIKI